MFVSDVGSVGSAHDDGCDQHFVAVQAAIAPLTGQYATSPGVPHDCEVRERLALQYELYSIRAFVNSVEPPSQAFDEEIVRQQIRRRMVDCRRPPGCPHPLVDAPCPPTPPQSTLVHLMSTLYTCTPCLPI